MSIPILAVFPGVWSWVGCRGRRWESVKPRGMEEIQRRKVRSNFAKPRLHRELCEEDLHASGIHDLVGLSDKLKTSLRLVFNLLLSPHDEHRFQREQKMLLQRKPRLSSILALRQSSRCGVYKLSFIALSRCTKHLGPSVFDLNPGSRPRSNHDRVYTKRPIICWQL
jgi:hypothetical protein